MVEPFIRNHDFNALSKQVTALQRAASTVSDPRIVESVRQSALAWVQETFADATEPQRDILNGFASLTQSEEFQHYLQTLDRYRIAHLDVSEKRIAKLYPKIKKLKVPDLAAIDLRKLTYLGWTDIAAGRMFLVYPLNGEPAGVEGRFTPAKKGVCFICNRVEDVALFTTVAKSRPANASLDYYKAIGQYMCLDSETCNRNITDVTALEKFLTEALKKD
ncbi:FusB/FusC family EF-G-binding protein [Gorillibacterium sp. sgz500922]|uniref:FusB/FusC family EF-G-binding protein n=1 Tax=Gorillibacterium sp. sgz500922 TaxID=3446694 RepID=UPI003F672CE3